jgi:hypothetical protein
MKTRTLLLLSLACGAAIMLAGAVFLVQLSGQDDVEPAVELGATAIAGDMTVVVESATERAGRLVVAVRIGGVDDADGADGFRLIASGRAVGASEPGTGDRCGATSSDVEPCTVEFDVSAADGTSRVLFYERGDTTLRWVLA